MQMVFSVLATVLTPLSRSSASARRFVPHIGQRPAQPT
jgi:hypothetical protein